MSWDFSASLLQGVRSLKELVELLARRLSDLFHRARFYERVAQIPYGATVRPSGDTSQVQLIIVPDNNDFTIADPTNPREGVILTLDIQNDSGGPMGDVTWGSAFKLDGPFVAPGQDEHAVYTFAWVPQ